MERDTYFFFPPKGLGEVAASDRGPMEVPDITVNELCELTHGRYRGWRVAKELRAYQVFDMPQLHIVRTVTVEDPDHLSQK